MPEPPGCRLIVREPKIAADTRVADSISVNGCCLTVIDRDGETFAFQAGPETLAPHQPRRVEARQPGESRTGAGRGRPAGRAFCQRTHRRPGHLLSRDDCGDWSTFWFSVPRGLAVQMASKGSIAVDGVSLTIVAQRARPLQRRPDPLHVDRNHARPACGRATR